MCPSAGFSSAVWPWLISVEKTQAFGVLEDVLGLAVTDAGVSVHPDLERLLSEDETARAGVDRARSAAHANLDLARASLAREREERLRQLQQALDRTIAQMLTEADREVERRCAQRNAHTRANAARGAALVDRAADLWGQIVREGPPPKVLP